MLTAIPSKAFYNLFLLHVVLTRDWENMLTDISIGLGGKKIQVE